MAPADHERIVAAARALIEAGGVEALSMRKLAAEVGVAPTAIYWHVGSREDLLNAVLDAMVDDLPPIAARGTSARARLASVARSIRDQVRATTPTQQLAAELGRTAELSFPGQVALTREMQAAGVGGSDSWVASSSSRTTSPTASPGVARPKTSGGRSTTRASTRA